MRKTAPKLALLATVLAPALIACGGSRGQTAAKASKVATSSAERVTSITVSKSAVTLTNPAATSGTAGPQRVTVGLQLAGTNGQTIPAGTSIQPVKISIYGPAEPVLSTPATTIRAATSQLAFNYNGRFFANPIIVNVTSGGAFAQMSFQPKNRGFAAHSSIRFPMKKRNNIAKGFGFEASIGGGPEHFVEMDTGSRGVVVPANVLGPDAIGPGPAGMITYSSDGFEFLGHYYLAPITLSSGGASVATVPIRVLAVDATSCAPGYPNCKPNRSYKGLGLIGVGFNRGQYSSMPPELSNAFLALIDIADGSMHPGYIINKRAVTLGITPTNQRGFRTVRLKSGGSGPGDWNTEPGCFSFPALKSYPHQCGTVLVDTGIASAILSLPKSKRPRSIAQTIPNGTSTQIAIGKRAAPVLSYKFKTGSSSNPMAPTSIRWAAAGSAPFVNTGRDPISRYDYMFDDGSGRVGFRAN